MRSPSCAARSIGADDHFNAIVAKVIALVEEPRRGHDLPLDVRGTAFQQRVWLALSRIPAGQTASYSEIARRIGAPKAVRAVASACAANALAVAIPLTAIGVTQAGLVGLLVVWIGIVLVNAVYNR